MNKYTIAALFVLISFTVYVESAVSQGNGCPAFDAKTWRNKWTHVFKNDDGTMKYKTACKFMAIAVNSPVFKNMEQNFGRPVFNMTLEDGTKVGFFGTFTQTSPGKIGKMESKSPTEK